MRHITNVMSRLFGVLANHEFTPFLQKKINNFYIKLFDIDMSDFAAPNEYKSLRALFTRSFVKPPQFKCDKNALLCMCDSLITEVGAIDRDFRALQIKGFLYSIEELLGDFILRKDKERLKDGVFVNYYLSPSDYHRYHAPCDMRVTKAVHIAGNLYPVNLKWLHKKAALFAQNERVVLECENADKTRFYLVYVGALNVGKMRFNFDDTIRTNAKISAQTLHLYDDLHFKQGEELGFFELGSTVLFLGEGKFTPLVKAGDKVKYFDKALRG